MKLKDLTALFSGLGKKKSQKGMTAIVFTDGGVALANISYDQKNSQPVLNCCEYIPSDNPFADEKRIRDRIEALGLNGSRAVTVLSPGSYQMMLVEAPEVPLDEVKEALRWRIKDLISFDIEETAIDFIELPDDAYRGRSKMIYAVAAEKAQVDMLAGWIEIIGMELAVVDIPELAMLNLAQIKADSPAGMALFSLGSPSSGINMLTEAGLYFTRALGYDAKRAESSPEDSANVAVLEIQRSLDYYESQVGMPPCLKLLVSPLQPDDTPLMTTLRYNLPVEVEALDLNKLVVSSQELTPELQKQAILAVAAALRSDGAAEAH
ncbi:type IV pilus biogenesis protein PilM [Marinobacterium jannaschii]|uniref:type IV pilus biogenesis protein PilM n=1 Tax=Marinobacterium jannaschii TaxID=64970 RepID=UPI000B1AA320|nr:hypothetical protein [Marinobacterium jannaschii]